MTSRTSSRTFAPILIAALAAVGAGGAEQPKTATTTTTGHEGHQHAPAAPSPKASSEAFRNGGQRMTITGEVMDPACFLEAGVKSIGPGHFQCAIDCARSGQTLAIYDRENDRIYFIAGELPGRNPNDPVIRFVHKKVDVTGAVYHRAGAYGIVIQKVELHKAKGSAAKTPAATGSAGSASKDGGR